MRMPLTDIFQNNNLKLIKLIFITDVKLLCTNVNSIIYLKLLLMYCTYFFSIFYSE